MQDARWHMSAECGSQVAGRMVRAGLAAVLAAWGPALPASAASAASGETVVHLYPSATVCGDEVRLADVASLHGEGAELAAGWTVAAAPPAGERSVLPLAELRNLLAAGGANLGRWTFRGSLACEIRRPADGAASRPAPEASGGTILPSGPTTRPAPASRTAAEPASTTRPAGPAPAHTLEQAIRERIAVRLSDLGGTPVVRFGAGLARSLGLASPPYEFRISDRGERLLGMVPLEVGVYEHGRLRQQLTALVEVSVNRNVVVAAGPINTGQIIDRDDLAVEPRSFTRAEGLGTSDPGVFIGQRARTLIARGTVLEARDIEPVPLVSRNDLVTVWAGQGGLRIKMVARALSEAGYGQPVTLKNESSRETFVATVTGPRAAEISAGGGGQPAGGGR